LYDPNNLRVLKPIKTPSGFLFCPVSYLHDPEKATREWEEKERAKYHDDLGWAREYEIDFGQHSGTPAYPAYREDKHVVKDLAYDDTLPLLLAMDFNAHPMSLVIAHLENGWLRVFDEVVEGPTTIDDVLETFRTRYPAHRGDLIFYGDATRGTTSQTNKSNWMVVQAAMRGYSVKPKYKVPLSNPNIGDRLNAVNMKLANKEGGPGVQIAQRCKELRQDLREVLLTPDNKKIYKVHKSDDPYFLRTHASDALGYLIFMEWPVVKVVMGRYSKPRKPLNKGGLLGENFGLSRGRK
jgi:hypothetical protein